LNTSGGLRVDGSGVTQPVSGTVTANIGTTNGLALDTSVNGLLLSQGSTTSGEKGPLAMGAVTTSAPSYTTAQSSPLSLNTSGGLRVDGSGVTQPVSGTVTANQGTNPWTDNISQWGGTNVLTGGSNGSVGVGGLTANGATAVGNPVMGGWVYNSTQPTVTTGQVVDAQATARGALIVATGVDTFTVTATQATGTNLHVVCDSGCSSSTAPADESAFTAGTTPQSPVGGFFQTTATNNALTNLQMGAFQVTANRALFTNLRNASGTEVGTASTPLQVSIANTGSNGTNVNIAGTVTANQGTSPWVDNVTQWGSNNVVTGGTNGSVGVGGLAASGATAVGNPDMVGGVFNSTQPTVTTGQVVDLQATARGALIVGTGVDTFTVTGNEGGAPWSFNLTQIAGNSVSTAATGVQKVGITGNTGAAMDAAGQNAASPNNELLTGCQFNTSPTGITSGNMSPIQCDTNGKVLVNAGTVTVTGTVTANQGGSNWSQNVAQWGGTNVLTGGSNGSVGVGGLAASGATASGNPVMAGWVYNSTQPTVTTGQTVDAQATARGALIVATGVDTLSASASQSGTWTVQPGNTQNTTPWLTSIVGGGNTASVNASNQLAVNCANCSGSGVSQQDNTGFTYGSGNMVPIGGAYNTTLTPLTSGDAGVAQMTSARGVHENLRNSNGQELGAVLPGQYSPPLQTNQAPVYAPVPRPSFPYPLAPAVKGPLQPANTYDPAQVVTLSPTPVLQCPYVVAINQTASTTVITGVPGKYIHICGWKAVSATQQGVSLGEGTGTTCRGYPTPRHSPSGARQGPR
jgi:hypothetical protein